MKIVGLQWWRLHDEPLPKHTGQLRRPIEGCSRLQYKVMRPLDILSDFHIEVDRSFYRIAGTDIIIHVRGTVVPSFDLSTIIQDELSTIILG